MDGKHFDELSRVFAAQRTRRGFLGALGAAIAGLAVRGSVQAAPAQTKPTQCFGGGSPCTNRMQCCSGTCSNRRCITSTIPGCTRNTDCGTNTDCQTYTCVNDACSTQYVANGTRVPDQKAGDCWTTVCNGTGGMTSVDHDTDIPIDTYNCTHP